MKLEFNLKVDYQTDLLMKQIANSSLTMKKMIKKVFCVFVSIGRSECTIILCMKDYL
ncbi:hypothetical protein [Bacillus manliponensis]|uniref:hypothetical protein n=1 Tax=Bacillus manliponensis TaxID=574376 RepID=UPI0012F97A0E|nr:hypothetical protein [Bacillus manliponensis]